MNIKSTKITHVLLMKFDEIPLGKLIQPDFLDEFAKLFGFNRANVAESPEGAILIVAEHGIYKSNGKEYPIDRVLIEERRIQLVGIQGTSKQAYEIMAEIKNYLGKVIDTSDADFLEPIIIAEESEIIAQLEFGYEAIFSPSYLDFIESDALPMSSTDVAEADYKFAQLAFNIDYVVTDKSLSDYRITLSRKEFRLEPRKGYPLSDRVYYSKAPISTQDHLDLLTSLENLLAS